MSANASLTGSELIDCARANGSKGIEIACERCGYGHDMAAFEQALQQAGAHLGIEIHGFDDLVNPPEKAETGVEVAPESLSQL